MDGRARGEAYPIFPATEREKKGMGPRGKVIILPNAHVAVIHQIQCLNAHKNFSTMNEWCKPTRFEMEGKSLSTLIINELTTSISFLPSI